MTEFMSRDTIIFTDSLTPGDGDRKFKVSWTWRNLTTNIVTNKVEERIGRTMDEVYDIWREENWREMFDPFKVKLEEITIRAIT